MRQEVPHSPFKTLYAGEVGTAWPAIRMEDVVGEQDTSCTIRLG